MYVLLPIMCYVQVYFPVMYVYGASTMCKFDQFQWNCNCIVLDNSIYILCFQNYSTWAVTWHNISRARAAWRRFNMWWSRGSHISPWLRVILEHSPPKSGSALLTPNLFTPSIWDLHAYFKIMESAILIVCFLASFIFALFGVFICADILDKLSCRERKA